MPKEPQSSSDKPYHVIIGEMFSRANVQMPGQTQRPTSVQGGFTPTNVLLPAQPQNTPKPAAPTHNNGFTPSNVIQPAISPKPTKGAK